MKLAIMQPYFLPYIGYYQLISAVDTFILYDNIKYTKKGWINRNRILQNGKGEVFTLPLKKDSDYLNVIDRELAKEYNRKKLLNQFYRNYINAPYFKEIFPLLEKILHYERENLFHYIHHALQQTCAYVDIKTPIKISSSILIDHDLRGEDKVLSLCKALEASTYINAIGGEKLYSHEYFNQHGIALSFLQSKSFIYPQFEMPFVPWLSIIDVLMFNSIDVVKSCIKNNFELI